MSKNDDWQAPDPSVACDGPCCGGSVPMPGDWDYQPNNDDEEDA